MIGGARQPEPGPDWGPGVGLGHLHLGIDPGRLSSFKPRIIAFMRGHDQLDCRMAPDESERK